MLHVEQGQMNLLQLNTLAFPNPEQLIKYYKGKGIAMILFQKLKLLCPQKSFCD